MDVRRVNGPSKAPQLAAASAVSAGAVVRRLTDAAGAGPSGAWRLPAVPGWPSPPASSSS